MRAVFQRVWIGVFAAAAIATSPSSAPAAAANAAGQGLKVLNSDVVRVVYPYDLAMAGTDATVEVGFVVDPDGAATDVTVTKASNQDAAASFLAALDEMVFETAQRGGKPVVSETQTLSVSLRQLQLSGDLSFIAAIKNPAAVVTAARDVDGGLKPAGRLAAALFPSSLRKTNLRQGKAVLEFYIDPAGIVRLPKVLSATDPAFGWSAASAVLTWRFVPPMKGGQPAIVKVTGLPVDFTAAAAATPSTLDAPAANRSKTTGSGLTATVQISSAITQGSKVKVNGTLSEILPTRVALEVDESGFATRQYVIALSLNIVPKAAGAASGLTDASQFVIEPGEPVPSQIIFETDGPRPQGTAAINRPR